MKIKSIFLLVVISLVFAVNSHAQENTKMEINPDGWPIPDEKTAQAKSKTTKKLGGVEAVFELFITPENTVFNKISTNGKTWAYLVDTDGKKPMEYILVKSNKFANFDMKAPATESVAVPDWVKN